MAWLIVTGIVFCVLGLAEVVWHEFATATYR